MLGYVMRRLHKFQPVCFTAKKNNAVSRKLETTVSSEYAACFYFCNAVLATYDVTEGDIGLFTNKLHCCFSLFVPAAVCTAVVFKVSVSAASKAEFVTHIHYALWRKPGFFVCRKSRDNGGYAVQRIVATPFLRTILAIQVRAVPTVRSKSFQSKFFRTKLMHIFTSFLDTYTVCCFRSPIHGFGCLRLREFEALSGLRRLL
nr:MAG TPA: hypothetical protein [Caudoviricetes sp.]